MRTPRRELVPGALGWLGLVVIALTGCSSINSETNVYATLQEARQAGAIAQGWVPDGLPPGATDIREAHVPGTADRWGLFNFPPAESETLRALLQPEEFPLHGERPEAPARIEWWPMALRGDIDGARVAATGVRAYRAKQGDLVIAVNWKQGRGYYWTASR